jgi:hypothetical protein
MSRAATDFGQTPFAIMIASSDFRFTLSFFTFFISGFPAGSRRHLPGGTRNQM